MPPDLRDLFERALDDDPGPPPRRWARDAMDHGIRIRRRRTATVAGTAAAVVLAVGALAGVNLAGAEVAPAPPVVAALPPMAQLPAGCVTPAADRATDVALFLDDDITNEQRQHLSDQLTIDGRLAWRAYESRENAYEKFKVLWRDSPDFVKSVSPESLPASFRAGLRDPGDYPAIAAKFAGFAGVEQLVGSNCPGGGK